MIGKKINQLATELAPVSTDLTIIGDPTTGVSKKITLAQLGAIFSGAVAFYTNLASFPATGSIDIIYCAKDTQKLYLWSGSAYVEVFPSQALLDTYQLRSEKGNANGYASLDSLGKVPISQLPSSIMEYKGTWNASTNTPTLANGTGDTGDVYICNVAGTVNFGAGPITFAVGDYVIYSGTIWQRSSGAVGTVTSVAASITGNSLSITGSPVVTSGTLAFAFAGNATQYVRGDGQLATLPTNGGGGGASVSYYLNGSINQGTIGGVTYYEMNKTPIIGAGTDFSRSSNGYIASFLTDANDPALLNIPAGNFNFETYFEASSGGGSPTFYIELYKYDGTTFTLIASNSTTPKLINDGANIEAYFSALAVPQTTLTLTDRLAISIYVTTAGRTITLHTENGHLCQVITTFTTGLTALNGLTAQVQYFATGTSGSDFNISSATATHTFNLPTASATNRGALSSADWTTFNNKQNALTNPVTGTGTTNTLSKFTGESTIGNSNITDTGSLITLGSNSFVNGSLGIGINANSTISLRVSKTITGGTTSYGIYNSGTVQSDVTAAAWNNISELNTVASAFTLSNYYHYGATQGSIGAGSTITSQFGFIANSNMIGATNNYGFFGNIPSGTNRWNLYMSGTANNYMAGSLGIGTTSLTGQHNLRVSRNISGSTIAYGILNEGITQSDVTNFSIMYTSSAQTAAAAFTLNNMVHYYAQQSAIGAGSAITTQSGFWAESNLIGATNNYGFRGAIPSGTNRWNLYMDGTASNYLAGSLGIGTTSLAGYNLRVNKTITGSTSGIGIQSAGAIQSDVSDAAYFSSGASTQAATFTLTDVAHFIANQSALGAGSTITKQYGFRVAGSLTGGTNNYAFFSDIAAGTNRWNLYMNGTANNYLAGSLGIGSTSLTGYNLRISLNPSAATAYGIMQDGLALSSVTTSYHINRTLAQTQAATFTLPELAHFYATQGTFGAGSTVTNQYGFITGNLTGGLSNYGFFGQVSSGTNRWNLYMDGTANNYMAGSLGIGTIDLSAKLTVVGATTVIGQTNVSARFSDNVESTLLISHPASTGNTATITGNNQLAFATGTVGNIAERMRITSGGNVGIGTTSLTGYTLRTSKNITGAVTSYGVTSEGQIQSDVTSSARMFWTFPSIIGGHSITDVYHYITGQGTFNGTATNQYGFVASSSLTSATNNFGFWGNIPSGTNRWNIYMAGTAANYMAGDTSIGTTTGGYKLNVNGTFNVTGTATFSGKTNIVKSHTDYAFTVVNTDSNGYGMYLQAGSTNNAIDVFNAAGTTQIFKLTGTGSVAITGQYNTVLPSSSFSYFDGSGQVVSSSSNASALYLDTTWNTTGNPDGIYLNVTNTASGASSKLLNLKVGSVSQFSVSKAGAIQTTAPSSGSAQPWKLGSYAAGGTGTATGVIYIEINGQIYSIPALQGTP